MFLCLEYQKILRKKMAIKSNHVLEKIFINLCKPWFGHVQEKSEKKWKKQRETIATFSVLKTTKNGLLTLIYGLHSSFTTLSTWWTKQLPVMKFDALLVLPIYPALKAQSHEKSCENILKKTEQQYNPIPGL